MATQQDIKNELESIKEKHIKTLEADAKQSPRGRK